MTPLKFVLFSTLTLAATANAQMVFGITKIGPKVVVFGDQHKPTQIFVDEQPQGTILPSGNWAHDFAAHYNDGGQWITISARVCESAKPVTITLWPPSWTTNPTVVGKLSLNETYLGSNPDEEALGKRVDEIKKSIDKRLGHKAMQKEIDTWLKQVKHEGLRIPGATCENPTVVQGYRVRIGVPYDGYYTHNTITLYIHGSADTGYQFQVNQVTRTAW